MNKQESSLIVIAVDTLRADHLGCYGYFRDTSPNIDGLAEDGILFKQCLTPSPLTTPAFASVMTSLPPHRHGAKRNGINILPDVQTLAQVLLEHGFQTGAFVSNWPLKKRLSGLDRGFEIYGEVFDKKRWMGTFNPEGRAESVNRQVFDWLEKRDKAKRFFLWVHYSEPHAPYIYHKKYDNQYNEWKSGFYHPDSDLKKMRKYDTEIGYVDHYIGLLLDRLKQLGLYENNVIVFLADHGESFGENGESGHGRKLFNSTLHVPLLVKLPGQKDRGKTWDNLVSLMDMAPTALEILGIGVPDMMQGKTLCEPDPDRQLFCEAYKGAMLFKRGAGYISKAKPLRYAMTWGKKKLMFSQRGRRFRFYDFGKDNFERTNMYMKMRGELGPFIEKLNQYIIRVKKFLKLTRKYYKHPARLTQDDLEKFKALGYL